MIDKLWQGSFPLGKMVATAAAAACVISVVRLLMDCYGVPVNYRKIKVNNVPVFVVTCPLHHSFRDYLIAPYIRDISLIF